MPSECRLMQVWRLSHHQTWTRTDTESTDPD